LPFLAVLLFPDPYDGQNLPQKLPLLEEDKNKDNLNEHFLGVLLPSFARVAKLQAFLNLIVQKT
jgi:hypothetical protein